MYTVTLQQGWDNEKIVLAFTQEAQVANLRALLNEACGDPVAMTVTEKRQAYFLKARNGYHSRLETAGGNLCKIQAIKRVREITGMGLTAAKEFVESAETTYRYLGTFMPSEIETHIADFREFCFDLETR